MVFQFFLVKRLQTIQLFISKKMKALGFDGIFTSLHIPEDDTSLYRQRLTDLGAMLRQKK